MANDDPTTPGTTPEGSWSPRRGRPAKAVWTSAAAAADATEKAAKDPAALASDIERTREELAETLDAIADKVSPKRVAGRTRKKVADAAKDAVETAKDSVHSAKDAATGKAADAKEAAASKAADAKVAATAKASEAKATARTGKGSTAAAPAPGVVAAESRVGDDATASPLPSSTTTIPGAEVPLEPAPLPADSPGALADAAVTTDEPAGAEAPARAPSYASSTLAPAPASKAPLLAGAAAGALVVLWFLRRRRR